MIHTSMLPKHIHKVKFYPSADDFTQAPLVMLVTNIMSDQCALEKNCSWPFLVNTPLISHLMTLALGHPILVVP